LKGEKKKNKLTVGEGVQYYHLFNKHPASSGTTRCFFSNCHKKLTVPLAFEKQMQGKNSKQENVFKTLLYGANVGDEESRMARGKGKKKKVQGGKGKFTG